MFVLNYCHGGYDGDIVSVEADLRNGIPGIDIVGMADVAVKESAERVRIAVKNSGLEFPKSRVAVNLAPAGVRKEGAYFDLSIAVAILSQFGTVAPADYRIMVLGELELSGRIRAVKGTLSAVIAGQKAGADYFIVPEENYLEACSAFSDRGCKSSECTGRKRQNRCSRPKTCPWHGRRGYVWRHGRYPGAGIS